MMNKELWKSYESCLKNDAIGCHEYSLVFKNHRIFTLRKDFFISPDSGFNFLCYFFLLVRGTRYENHEDFVVFFLFPRGKEFLRSHETGNTGESRFRSFRSFRKAQSL